MPRYRSDLRGIESGILLTLLVVLACVACGPSRQEYIQARVRLFFNEPYEPVGEKALAELEALHDPEVSRQLVVACMKHNCRRDTLVPTLVTSGGEAAIHFLEDYYSVILKEREEPWRPGSSKDYPDLPAEVALALYKLGREEYADFLYKEAVDPKMSPRWGAAKALGEVDTPRSRELLLRLLFHERTTQVQGAAALSLVKLGYPGIRTMIREAWDKGQIGFEGIEDLIQEPGGPKRE